MRTTDVDSMLASIPQFRSTAGGSAPSWVIRPRRSLADHFALEVAMAPIIVLPDPNEDEIDVALLIRLGDGVPVARQARTLAREFLVSQLEAAVRAAPPRFAITTMPERWNAHVEHTFISFVRQLARDLGIECINDRFQETRARHDVSDVARHKRSHSLEDAWVYEGRLDGKLVILLDDVMDTGVSLRTAARVLTSAGASVVPIALLRMHDENSEVERTLRRTFGAACGALLGLPEVHGSLRRLVESCSKGLTGTSDQPAKRHLAPRPQTER